jgi:hypothetical protein
MYILLSTEVKGMDTELCIPVYNLHTTRFVLQMQPNHLIVVYILNDAKVYVNQIPTSLNLRFTTYMYVQAILPLQPPPLGVEMIATPTYL